MTTTFSPTEAVAYGWDAIKRNLGILLPLGVLQVLLSSIQGSFATMPRGAGALPHLVAQAAQVALAMGWWRIALRVHDGKPVSLAALAEISLGPYLQYLVTILLYGLVVGVGLVLLVVPGLVWGARYALAPVLVVDEDLDAISAMRRSAELTRGAIPELLALALLLAGVNLVGLLACGFGLAVTIPISGMAAVHAYRVLRARGVERGIVAPEPRAGAPLEVPT